MKKVTIEDMQKIAREREGKCLSRTYKNIDTKLIWECAKGHRWSTIPYLIITGSWCPHCAGNVRLTIEEMQRIAGERGGKCLSKTYLNTTTKLLWECAEGHQWEALPLNIKRGRWCNICSTGYGERVCREFFEQMFKRPFPKSYPKWLLNSRGNRMELDGYNEELNFAFEHHGLQHYENLPFFHNSEEAFEKRKLDDEEKRKLCIDNNIVLIEVPEISTLLPLESLRSFIEKECIDRGFILPVDFNTREINLSKAYITALMRQALNAYVAIAKARGGKCLSKDYVNSSTRLQWQCEKGHQWKAYPISVRKGAWCPHCAGNAKLGIHVFKQIAEERGGKCLSRDYVNSATKLHWQCAEGHQWKATPGHVVNGTWCPDCKGTKKLTIEAMQDIALERGGKCLSPTYQDSQSNLLWECNNGHQWEASPTNIRAGKWCRRCYHKKRGEAQRHTIADIRKLAETRGGICLSEVYVSTHAKLLWECSIGHQWSAVPSSVKRGSWCPVCARKKAKS